MREYLLSIEEPQEEILVMEEKNIVLLTRFFKSKKNLSEYQGEKFILYT